MYIIIWEFHPKTGRDQDFEKAYRSDGVWAQLFQKGSGFLGTELIKQIDGTGYITIDRWSSEAAYHEFRSQYGSEYKKIDEVCESLTQSENLIGLFSSVD